MGRKGFAALIVAFVMAVGTSLPASARYYRNSLGIRAGNLLSAEYKYMFSDKSAVDVNFGVVNPFTPHYQFLLFSGAYHFHFANNVPGVLPYIGAGLSCGMQFGDRNMEMRQNTSFFMSADIPIGFEYILRRYPVAFVLEWSPKIQFLSQFRFIAQSVSLGVRFNF